MNRSHAHSAARPFAEPGHDHRACARDVVARAEKLCAARGSRLTDIRRRVLEALAVDHAPAGAYEVIDRLARDGDRAPAPITIYRALDFLVENGLVHRIESRNAFIACNRDHGDDAAAPVVFLICERCGAVGEAASASFSTALASLVGAVGFAPRAPVVEVSGECAHCRRAATEDAS